MARTLIAIAVIGTAVTLYSLFACALSDRSRVRLLPKAAWIAVIIFLPIIGAVLWLLFGRDVAGRARAEDVPAAPDNDPDYLKKIADDLEMRRLREMRDRTQREADDDSEESSGS